MKNLKRELGQWLRNSQTWGFFVSVAVMAIIALAFFYPDNFQGNSLMQHDMQQGIANGHEIQQYYEATGHKPLWTESLMSGMPTFQISPSYPSNSLFSWLNTVYGLGLPVPSNLLFMMMLGFLILAYCMGMRWQIGLLGAIAWGLSSYFVIIIGAGHIWKFVCLSYIPPTIGGIILCYRGRWLIGGALTALFAMLQLNANHPQMTYYFGLVIVLLALAYLWKLFFEKKMRAWWLGSAAAIVAGLLAFGANLPALYNTYEYTKETKRSQSELSVYVPAGPEGMSERPTGGLPRQEILNWSYGRTELLSLLVPNIKGGGGARPENGKMTAVTMADVPGAEDVPYDVAYIPTGDSRPFPTLQFFSQYFNDSESTNGPVYVGAIICALFLLGCFIVKGPVKWALLFATVFSILLSLGYNLQWLSDFMIYNFPLYSKFRAVESILVVAEFCMPLLAVLALCKYFDKRDEKKEEKRLHIEHAMLWCFGACASVCCVLILWPQLTGDTITSNDQHMLGQLADYVDTQRLTASISALRLDMVRADAGRSLIFLAFGCAALWLYSRRRISFAITSTCLIVLVAVDLYTVDKRYISSSSFAPATASTYYGDFRPDPIDQAILRDTTLSYRVLDIPNFGSATRSYHHKMLGGYHAAKLNRYEDLINEALSPTLQSGYHPEIFLNDSILFDVASDQEREMLFELRRSANVINMLNTRYIITGDPQQPLRLNPYALGNAWFPSHLRYSANARDEMDMLMAINPAYTVVADQKYADILGPDGSLTVAPTDTIYLQAYAPDALTYKAKSANGGIAVFSEIFFPWGWKATIDGQPAPIARADYTLRAMRIPAGEHTIAMTFDPDSLHVTAAFAYACVTIIYLWLLLALGRWFFKKEE